MFNIIRSIIASILLVGLIIFIKKSKSTRKRMLYVVSVCASVMFAFLLFFVPFESLFITFDSPEKAYEYMTGESKVDLIVSGKECDLLITRDDIAFSNRLVPKTEDGWKISGNFDSSTIELNTPEKIFAMVYRYKNTNDYFLAINHDELESLDLSDDYGTEFYPFEWSSFYGKKRITYFAYIPNFNSEYTLTINGEKIVFN